MLEPIRKDILNKSSDTNNTIELYAHLRKIIFEVCSIHTQLKITKSSKPKLICKVKSAVEASELRLHEDEILSAINSYLTQISQSQLQALTIKIKD